LLDHGRAVGAKPLKEYMEVRGYGQAAQWPYSQALEPTHWHHGDRAHAPKHIRGRSTEQATKGQPSEPQKVDWNLCKR
jgi:hypothetical protein